MNKLKPPLIGLLFFLLLVGCSKAGEQNLTNVEKEFESGRVTLYGIPNKLAIVKQKSVSNTPNRYMWHFWGEREKESVKKFNVKGYNYDDGRTSNLLAKVNEDNSTVLVEEYSEGLGGPLNGADYSIPAMMVFPNPGLWRLDVYFDDIIFGSITLTVEGPD